MYSQAEQMPLLAPSPMLCSKAQHQTVVLSLLHQAQHALYCTQTLSIYQAELYRIAYREADNVGELEQLRIQYDHSEAARRDLEKRVKEAGTIQQRLLMACTVG